MKRKEKEKVVGGKKKEVAWRGRIKMTTGTQTTNPARCTESRRSKNRSRGTISNEPQIVISCHPVPALPTHKQRGIRKTRQNKVTYKGGEDKHQKKERKNKGEEKEKKGSSLPQWTIEKRKRIKRKSRENLRVIFSPPSSNPSSPECLMTLWRYVSPTVWWKN